MTMSFISAPEIWRCKKQHLVIAFEECLDLLNEELMMGSRLEPFMASPLAQAIAYRSAVQEFGCCT
jgi:hypothetical protein